MREGRTDAWHRRLHDGRLEIMCQAPGCRIRVSAPDEQAWEAVEMFERWTGLAVRCDQRPMRQHAQLAGQLAMTEMEVM
jgi:hypothetical protein